MFQDVLQLLERMGLKEKDGKVYLTCLHYKDGLYVHEIVKYTKIVRSTVDVILERLEGEGFISKVKVGARYKYYAESAESILFKREKLLEDFKALVPMLSRLGTETGETEVKFFEGRDGILKVYEDILLQLKYAQGEGRQLVSFAAGADVMKVYPDIQKDFIDKRKKLGIWYRAIVAKSSDKVFEYVPHAPDLRDVRFFDDTKRPFHVAFETYADSVMIISPTKPFGGVVIRNPKIAESMRSLFYLVWDLLPEEPQQNPSA